MSVSGHRSPLHHHHHLGPDGLGSIASFLVKWCVPGYGESDLLMTNLGFKSLRLRLKHIQLPHEASKPLMPVTAKSAFLAAGIGGSIWDWRNSIPATLEAAVPSLSVTQ